MKLYFVAGSPNCRKVQATAAQLGLALEHVPVDFAAGEHKQPAYLARNPNGLVPTLVDDGLCLWESNAIMQHLARKAPAGGLLPQDLAGQADVMRWQCWELSHLGRYLSGFLYERLFKPLMGGACDERLASDSRRAAAPFLDILEQQLARGPFVTGPTLTLADYSLAPQLDVMAMAGDALSEHTAIRAWLARLGEYPAWVQSRMPEPMALAIESAIRQSQERA